MWTRKGGSTVYLTAASKQAKQQWEEINLLSKNRKITFSHVYPERETEPEILHENKILTSCII